MRRAIIGISLSVLLGIGLVSEARAGNDNARVPKQSWRVGKGDPQFTIVYMHGWGGAPGSRMIRKIGQRMGRNRSFEVIEPNGWHGQKAHTMSGQLEAAREAIRAVPAERPVFVIGHSLGGKGAIFLTKDAEVGKRIKGYVALAPAVKNLHGAYKRAFRDQMTKAGLPSVKQVVATLANAKPDQGGNVGGLPLGFLKDLATYDERGTEQHVTTPGLVVHGKKDTAVSVFYARRFAKESPKANYVEYRLADHGLLGWFGWRTGKLSREIGRFIDTNL